VALDIPEIARLARADSGALYLATVVRTEGPCYRKVGARLLVGELGRLAGAVSGGCVERALVRRIEWLTRAGAAIETYDTAADGDETDASYLGCGGTIDVLLQRIDPALLGMLERVAGRDGDACIATVLSSADVATPVGSSWAWLGDSDGASAPAWAAAFQDRAVASLGDQSHRRVTADGPAGPITALVEYVPPPRRLLVAARHYDAGPLLRIAREAGWEVTLATGQDADDLGAPDTRIGLDEPGIDAWVRGNRGGAVVIMTHSVALDRRCLATALRAGPPRYLAVLGPSSRTRSLIEAIGDLPDGVADCVRAPAGLNLGGEGAASIAIAIVAELEKVYARRTPVLELDGPP